MDDDQVVASIYKNKLESERYDVEVAGSSERALQILAQKRADLVILDFSLLGMDGAEVLKTIRSQPGAEALPVIVLTNFYLPGVVQAASESGATRCVRKSDYTPRNMLMVVRELLASGHAFSGNPKSGAVPARIETASDFEADYQEKLIADFLVGAPQKLGRMRLSHHALVNSEPQHVRLTELSKMCRQARLLAGAAGIAGFREIAQLIQCSGSAFHSSVREPHEHYAVGYTNDRTSCRLVEWPLRSCRQT